MLFKIVSLDTFKVLRIKRWFCSSAAIKSLHENKVLLKQKWTNKLQQAEIPDPQESVKWISEHVEKKYSRPKNESSDPTDGDEKECFELEFSKLCARRLKREPVQYIIGDWDFRYLTLLMKPPVFIPRPETEGLVELVNEHLMSNFKRLPCKILELCCGTGAISLSLASENPMVECTAIDISEEAVALAKENAGRLNLFSSVSIHHCAIESFSKIFKGETFDVIVSNPPYVPTRDMQALQPEISHFEDLRALHGGETGLDIVKEILILAMETLRPNGTLWLEVDSTHPPLIKEFVEKEHRPLLSYIQSYDDIYHRPRFCALKYTPAAS